MDLHVFHMDLHTKLLFLHSKILTEERKIMTIFLCLLPIIIVSFFILSKSFQPSKYKLPPSPWSLPIIGNLHHLSGLFHRCIHKLSIKYGPVMLLRLGLLPMVVISSSKAAEEMLKTHDLECSSQPRTVGTEKLSYGFKDIAFAPYGEYWREMRKLTVIELFSLKKVQSFRHVREEEIKQMIKKVFESSSWTHSPIDLNKTFYTLAASIICRVALGQKFNGSELLNQEKLGELVTEASNALGDISYSDLFPGGLGRFVDWLFGKQKKLSKVFKELDTFYDQVINDHLKESRSNTLDTSPDIVTVMMDIIDNQGKEDHFKLTTDNIKAIIMNIFLAGIDSIPITMIWTMTELVRHPRVLKKVQEDVRTILGTGKKIITEEDVNKVDYLQCIIKETFRLHPPIPIVTRQTMSHLKIQGYDIPPNTSVQINLWTIGRDPKFWTEPENFIPERFINSSLDFRGHDFCLLPFGSGRRICPAIAMSMATIELGLLNMLYFFDWKLPGGMDIEDIDMKEVGSLSVVKKLPLIVVPVQKEP